MPRGRDGQPEKPVTRLLALLLLVLGLSLADLTSVWSPSLVAPQPAPTTALAGEDAGASACPAGACQPVAMAAQSGKRSATRARFSGPVDPGATRTHDLLARIVPLALLVPVAGLASHSRVRHVLSCRPAPETGARQQTPRPPPA